MSDDSELLTARLEDLHQRLAVAQQVSPEMRGLLLQLLSDVERLLAASASRPAEPAAVHPERLDTRLAAAAEHFQTAHPTLARALGAVADALSRLGI